MQSWILTLVTFLPLAGVGAILLLPRENQAAIRFTALSFALLTFAASLCLLFRFDSSTAAMQFEVDLPWVTALGIDYHLGIDGIALVLILLTNFLSAIAILSAFRAVEH